MSAARIGTSPVAGRLGGLSGVGQAPAGIATPATTAAAGVAPTGLAHVRYASTWPRGWMAAAVPQHVREFNAQVSKAQMTLAFLDALDAALSTLEKTAERQLQLPSPAGQARAASRLQAVQALWQQRYARTLGSLDVCLLWSPVQRARTQFALAGWTPDSLRSAFAGDKELVSFCLMGQDAAQGAWQAQAGRSDAASQYALAAALSPLQIQLSAQAGQLRCSVDERLWPVLLERFMVKGNGQRFPAGQWVAPPLQVVAQAVVLAGWSVADTASTQALQAAVLALRSRLAPVRQQVAQFWERAGDSLQPDNVQRLQQMQAFAQAFSAAGQAPAYDWVLAVVPAVRAISRRRVARLLKTQGALD